MSMVSENALVIVRIIESMKKVNVNSLLVLGVAIFTATYMMPEAVAYKRDRNRGTSPRVIVTPVSDPVVTYRKGTMPNPNPIEGRGPYAYINYRVDGKGRRSQYGKLVVDTVFDDNFAPVGHSAFDASWQGIYGLKHKIVPSSYDTGNPVDIYWDNDNKHPGNRSSGRVYSMFANSSLPQRTVTVHVRPYEALGLYLSNNALIRFHPPAADFERINFISGYEEKPLYLMSREYPAFIVDENQQFVKANYDYYMYRLSQAANALKLLGSD